MPPSTAVYYTLNAIAGHSYAIEVWDPFDSTAGIAPTIQVLQSDCSTQVNVTDVTGVDPSLSNGFSARVSWIQTTAASQQIAVTNPDGANGYYYYIRVSDTTQFNPRWSTWGGFVTEYGFTNTGSTQITGVVTLTDVVTDTTFTYNVTIPPGSAAFPNIGPGREINVPANRDGSGTFAYVGPAGAVLPDCLLSNAYGTVIISEIFVGKSH